MVSYSILYQEGTSIKRTLAFTNRRPGCTTSTKDGKTKTETSATGTETETGSCFGREKGCGAVKGGEEETEFKD